jgi:phosphoenolpyruvate carboxylase
MTEPLKIHNVINGEWMWEDTFNARIQMKHRSKLPMGEWTGEDRDGHPLTVVWVSSRWKPMGMLDVYVIEGHHQLLPENTDA